MIYAGSSLSGRGAGARLNGRDAFGDSIDRTLPPAEIRRKITTPIEMVAPGLGAVSMAATAERAVVFAPELVEDAGASHVLAPEMPVAPAAI